MKGNIEVRHWKKKLGLDAQKNVTATYTDQGMIQARMWPASGSEKGEPEKRRFLMIFNRDCTLEESDRIELGTRQYRALWVKAYPKHCEAVVEEEAG